MQETHIILMGVSGCGKSTVGAAMAKRLSRAFIEGDKAHPDANVAKMAAGTPLTDMDRDGWIRALCDMANAQAPSVISCSALNPHVRGWLKERSERPLRFVYLEVDPSVLKQRLERRPRHFMPVGLLDSQLSALDLGGEPALLTLNGNAPVEAIVDAALAALNED